MSLLKITVFSFLLITQAAYAGQCMSDYQTSETKAYAYEYKNSKLSDCVESSRVNPNENLIYIAQQEVTPKLSLIFISFMSKGAITAQETLTIK